MPATRPTSSLALVRSRTPRDRYLLHLLADHHVLTTAQISQAWGAPLRRTQHRLGRLLDTGVLDRFRPYRDYGRGSAPFHWTLGPIGALEAAAARDTTPSGLGWTPHRTAQLASSSQLAHRIGTNGLFTALIAHTHTHPGTRLDVWQPPGVFASGQPIDVRPDGYGEWITTRPDGTEQTTAFVLEHDTGSEPFHRLTGKLDRYSALAAARSCPLVLFRFLTPARERGARLRALAHHPAVHAGTLRVATTALPDPPDADPAGPIWTPCPDHQRLTSCALADLAGEPTPAPTNPWA
jgi:hypothetical protein